MKNKIHVTVKDKTKKKPRSYIDTLKTIYPSCKKDTDDLSQKYAEHKITYGEMSYESIELLYKTIVKKHKIKGFLDIGSGRGKLCLYMADKRNIDHSVGIELVKERLQTGICLHKQLKKEFFNIVKKVKFIHANIFDINLETVFPEKEPLFVWMSNLCFETDTTNQIFSKLVRELPKNSIVCFSKKPEFLVPGLKEWKTMEINMSWYKKSIVHICIIS